MCPGLPGRKTTNPGTEQSAPEFGYGFRGSELDFAAASDVPAMSLALARIAAAGASTDSLDLDDTHVVISSGPTPRGRLPSRIVGRVGPCR